MCPSGWTDSEISARLETFRYKYTNHSSVLSVCVIHVYVYELGRVCVLWHTWRSGDSLGCQFCPAFFEPGSLVVAYTRLAGL